MPFNEALDFTRASSATARTATGKIQGVLTDEQRLVGNREGLLIEEAQTNLITYSEQFDNAYWTKEQLSASANTVAAPDNTLTGDTITEDNTNDFHTIFTAATTAGEGTFSIFIKSKGDDRYLIIRPRGVGTGVAFVTFDPDAGTFSAAGGTGFVSAAMELVVDGWYRCSLTLDEATTYSPEFLLGDSPTSSEGDSYLGDGTSGLYVWGAQLVQGSPSSYIPTAGAQVTRAADNCVRVLGDEFNPSEGTLIFKGKAPKNADVISFAGMIGPEDSQRASVYFQDASIYAQVRGNEGSTTISEPFTPGQVYVAAVSYNNTTGDCVAAINGISGTFSNTFDAAGSELLIGDQFSSSAGNLNSTLSIADYLPCALSESELITLTGGTY
jgi:hypothetical protein